MHRDSTGVVQRIEPGAVNWMSAGRGIVHSERTPKELIDKPHRSHGLQLWIALPEADEDSAPSFQHVPAEAIPRVRIDGATAHVVVGSAFGATSPVRTASPTLAVVFDLDVASGTSVALPAADASERALYALDHPIEVDGVKFDECTMVVLEPGTTPTLAAPRGGRVVLVGGESLGHRFLSWNFVATTRERIRAAEDDWRRSALPAHPRRDRVHPASRAAGAAEPRPERVPGCSMSALPATASAAPAAVSTSGRKSSKAIETTQREQRRHDADRSGGADADAILQRQEAREGEHRAGEGEVGEREPPARRRRQGDAAPEARGRRSPPATAP